jgi:hypothetical protein
LREGDHGQWLRNRYFGYLLSFGFFNDRFWLIPPNLYYGLSEEILEIFFRFFQILTQSSNLCILLFDDGRERLDVLVFEGILDILRLSNYS